MIRSPFVKILGVTMLVLTLGSLTAAPVMAADITPAGSTVSVLDQGNTALGPFASPYATVSIGITAANTAVITVVADAGYLLGGQSAFGFNTSFNGTISNIVWSGGASDTSFTVDPNQNVSVFGNFKYTLDGFDGFTRAVSALQFTFTLNSGSFPGGLGFDPDNFLTFNGTGFDAEGHIFVIGQGVALNTGFAGEDGLGSCPNGQCRQSEVPEPASLLLLGTGLGFIGQRARRRIRLS
jgi:hypothetical protein